MTEVVSANEVRVPVGERVEFVLESPDVIHSFWIPPLGGKMDMIPGRTNRLSLQADRAGTFRGQCAEYCGVSHALMAFTVLAMPAAEFQDWLEDARRPADGARRPGLEIFEANGCGACHTIRGTAAGGAVGPDLSHLGGRGSIGAGVLPMSAASIARFITEPEAVKPGVAMPGYPATGAGRSRRPRLLSRGPPVSGADHEAAEAERLRAVWANPPGWRYWSAVNNTAIGIWYGAGAFVFMLFAGVLALLVRLQLAVPDNDLLSADFYNQAFTLHGTVMMFLFAVPIFEAVAIFLLAADARRPRAAVPAALRLRLLELPARRGLRLRLDLLRRRARRAAGSCTRRSPPTRSSAASAPTSGCSASPSSRSPRSPRRSRSSSAC